MIILDGRVHSSGLLDLVGEKKNRELTRFHCDSHTEDERETSKKKKSFIFLQLKQMKRKTGLTAPTDSLLPPPPSTLRLIFAMMI